MTEVVTEFTRCAYCNVNKKFIMWFIEEKEMENTLSNWFLKKSKKVKENYEMKNIEKNIRQMIKKSIETINSEKNFPIKLNTFNINIITGFIFSQRNSTDTYETTYYEKTTYTKMMSVFKNVYRSCGMEVSDFCDQKSLFAALFISYSQR